MHFISTSSHAEIERGSAERSAPVDAAHRRVNALRLGLGAILVFLLAAYVSAAWFDVPCARFFQGLRHTWVRGAAAWVNQFGQSQWYLVPGAAIYLYCRERQPLAGRKALYFFTVVAVSGIVADVIKFAVGRCRPSVWFEQGAAGFNPFGLHAEYLSFPSGHATTYLAAAAALAVLFPRRPAWLLGLGFFLALGRVVAVNHYLSDVFAGAALGVGAAMYLAVCTPFVAVIGKRQ